MKVAGYQVSQRAAVVGAGATVLLAFAALSGLFRKGGGAAAATGGMFTPAETIGLLEETNRAATSLAGPAFGTANSAINLAGDVAGGALRLAMSSEDALARVASRQLDIIGQIARPVAPPPAQIIYLGDRAQTPAPSPVAPPPAAPPPPIIRYVTAPQTVYAPAPTPPSQPVISYVSPQGSSVVAAQQAGRQGSFAPAPVSSPAPTYDATADFSTAHDLRALAALG